jgi:serine/threonine protein kinase
MSEPQQPRTSGDPVPSQTGASNAPVPDKETRRQTDQERTENASAAGSSSGKEGAAPGQAEAGIDVLLGSGVELSDDSPTIISRAPRSQEAGAPNNSVAAGAPPGDLSAGLRGRNLAHFELIAPIGVGGMAAVIRARDKQLDRIVALKILPPEMASDPENVRRFHQEARAAAKLDHENIARVFFCGEDQRLHFIAFEFVEGENLRTLLERRGRLPVAESVHYMLQIATGLAHAAARGVVHRDIKPSNIIISPSGRAKLVDMGLARSLEPHESRALTQSGVTLGTFDYISPEQALEPRDADVRSDIYSLGCTFYHMLTGQPPVPDGTAAKKLHHHQQVPPTDPRQLNPEIPDELAAILARMMAKDPKDRYQRAEHLVQHLLQLAQKVGSATEVPDGVLFVDAPLPNQPQRRPALVAALAALALGLFLVVLSFAPPGPSTGRSQRPKDSPADHQKDGPPKGTDGGQAKKDVTDPLGTRLVATLAQLQDALATPSVTRIVVANDLRLTDEKLVPKGQPQPGLLILGPARELVIEGKEGEPPPTLHIAYYPDLAYRSWAGFTVEGSKVTFRRLRFVIESDLFPKIFLAAVAQKGNGLVTLDRCEFEHKLPPDKLLFEDKPVKVASVLVDNTGDEDSRKPVALVAKETCFVSGQAALVVKGIAEIRSTNCAFGPHATHFVLSKGGSRFETLCKLDHCSLFVDRGPVFRLDGDTTCQLSARDCLFAWSNEDNAATETAFVLQTDNVKPAISYTGGHNCFARAGALWARRGKDQPPFPAINGNEWTRFLADAKGTDPTSFLLDRNPWESKRPLEEAKLKAQFRVNLKLPQLRPGGKLIGVQECSWGRSYTDEELLPLAPPKDVPVAKNHQKIIEPNASPFKEGVYRSVEEAVSAARKEKGEVVLLIKHTGPLPITRINVDEADCQITLKAYPDYHPVLTLHSKNIETNAALFRLHNGQLKFERLEFLLRPDSDKYEGQTVVQVVGNGQVKFDHCVFTLDDKALRPNVVTLDEIKGIMPMPGTRAAPEVHFVNCFLRGQGDAVKVPSSRPFELSVENSLVVLAGSFLIVEANSKEAALTEAQVKLKHVTTYLTRHLIHLSAAAAGRSVKGLVPTRVNPVSDCLFVAAKDEPLILLEGVENDLQMKTLVYWEGKGNAYSGFEKMLTQRPPDLMMLKQFKQEDWQTFTGNDNETFLKVKFEVPPLSERPFSQAMPDEFRLKLDSEYGASLQQIPQPYVPEDVAPQTPDSDD